MKSVRWLFGCEPDKYDSTHININPGSIADFYGNIVYEFPVQTQINLSSVGLWGYDRSGGIANGSNLNIYLLANDQGDCGFIASPAIYEGDVGCPVGYTVRRKLPWGVMYNTAWDCVPNFHLTHWPMPLITLTDSESSGAWGALINGQATTWTDVDLSPWIPDNARLALISTQLRYNNGAMSSYLRSHSGQATGNLIGSVQSNSAYSNNMQYIRVTSNRHIQYKNNSTGGGLYLYVMGYCMTEPA